MYLNMLMSGVNPYACGDEHQVVAVSVEDVGEPPEGTVDRHQVAGLDSPDGRREVPALLDRQADPATWRRARRDRKWVFFGQDRAALRT